MSSKQRKAELELAKLQVKAMKSMRRYDILEAIINKLGVPAVIATGIIIAINAIMPHPVDKINALAGLTAKGLEIVNHNNFTIYGVVFVLLIIILGLYYRNRYLTKELGKYRTAEESKDPNRSSSKLNEFGENKVGVKL
jgi:hypothetical protein